MPTYQKIILTHNSIDSAAPGNADIDEAELAINLNDGKIYTRSGSDILTLNKFATSDTGTANAGAISAFISENADGIGINTDPVSTADVKINSILEVTDKIKTSHLYGDGTNSLFLSGGTTESNSSNIEMSPASSSSHDIHYDADRHIFRSQDGTENFATLGGTAPKLTIGGTSVSTDACELKIGDGRTGTGISQIILRSKSGGATNANLAKIIRTGDDLKILNHTGHVLIHADNNKAVKLVSSADNNDSIETVNLIAKDGHVKIGDLGAGTGVNNNKALEVVGAMLGDTLRLDSEDALTFGGNDQHRITYNDEKGVFNFRAGHLSDQTDTATGNREEYTAANTGAAYIGAKNLGSGQISNGTQKLEFKVSSDTTNSLNGAVNWGEALILRKDRMLYNGSVGLGISSPQGNLHVRGDGGLDNVLFEANNNEGVVSSGHASGARLTLRSSQGTSNLAKAASAENQILGQIVTQGYQGTQASGAWNSAAKIDVIAQDTWTGTTDRNSKLFIRLRGTNDGTNKENTVMKLFPTDGGKVGINTPVELTNDTAPTLHVGGSQLLGRAKDEFIEHLRLDADVHNNDKLVFKTKRIVADDNPNATADVASTVTNSVNITLNNNNNTIFQNSIVTGTGITGTVVVKTVTDQNNIVLNTPVSLAAGTTLTFTDKQGWPSVRHRIQRIVDSTYMAYIDFGTHKRVQNSGNVAGDADADDLFVIGEGDDRGTAGDSGPGDEFFNADKKYFTVDFRGRVGQYGMKPYSFYPQAADAIFGTTGIHPEDASLENPEQSHGITIASPRGLKGNIFFADTDANFPGMISYDHLNERFDISVNGEGYPNSGKSFEGLQILGKQGDDEDLAYVGIGLTNSTPTQALHVNGQILATDDITAFSDERLKENVVTIPNALEKVSQLRGVEFTRKDGGKKGIGVIAQEIEEVIPEVVVTNTDEDETKSVAYGNIVGLLIEAIKDLQQEVEELKRNA